MWGGLDFVIPRAERCLSCLLIFSQMWKIINYVWWCSLNTSFSLDCMLGLQMNGPSEIRE